MDVLQKITDTVEPSLTAMGYTVVQMKLAEGSRRRALIIMAERADDVPMSFDDCTEISRTVSALMDVEDPITGAYDLEVMSPGLDRPLTRPEDFARFAGHEAKLETIFPIEGRKRFRGVIKGMVKGIISLKMPEGHMVEIPVGQVKTGKLVPEMPTKVAGPETKGKKKKDHKKKSGQ